MPSKKTPVAPFQSKINSKKKYNDNDLQISLKRYWQLCRSITGKEVKIRKGVCAGLKRLHEIVIKQMLVGGSQEASDKNQKTITPENLEESRRYKLLELQKFPGSRVSRSRISNTPSHRGRKPSKVPTEETSEDMEE